MERERLLERLFELADEGYRKFSSALSPGEEKMIGVRLPALRGIAREIARGEGWREYLASASDEYFEEIMVSGYVIGLCLCGLPERLSLIERHVPKLRGWSLCDSFCAGLKFAKKHPGEVFDFILPYLDSPGEFSFRFGVVMLMQYFLTEEYSGRSLPILFSLSHESVYGSLAIAWAAAEAAARLPDKAVPLFFDNGLDKNTLRLAARKARESFRISPEAKERITLACRLRGS